MLLTKCEVFDSKKPKFIKGEEASELLSSLGIKTPLNELLLFGRGSLNNLIQNIKLMK